MKHSITSVGLDTHKDSIEIALPSMAAARKSADMEKSAVILHRWTRPSGDFRARARNFALSTKPAPAGMTSTAISRSRVFRVWLLLPPWSRKRAVTG